jgi:hypothetical protein
MPAIERYDGPSFRTLRKWSIANPASTERIDVLILSAKMGLITADTLIVDYDQRMTSRQAAALMPTVSADLQRFVAAHGPYTTALMHLGQCYLLAITPAALQSDMLGTLTFTSGGIGTRLGQLKRWLTGLPNPMIAESNISS